MTRKKVVLLIFGEGGHQKEMELFTRRLPENHQVEFISIGHEALSLNVVAHYKSLDVRHKHSRSKSILMASKSLLKSAHLIIKLLKQYQITGAISTGPGMAILPFFILKLASVNTVFIETFCRFHTRSLTGRIMYQLAGRFLVQNKEDRKSVV